MAKGFLDQLATTWSGMIDALQEENGSLGGIFEVPRTADKVATLQFGMFASAVNHPALLKFAINEFITIENDVLVFQLLAF
jgi:hypothetical protein